jgi:probable HAF family extracellular repeat protein
MKRVLFVAATAAFLSTGVAAMASAATTTHTAASVTGTVIGPANSWGVAANSHGAVTGDLQVGKDTQGFVWKNGRFTNLGSLPGGNTLVGGINASGDVVGESGSSNTAWHAFEWSGGKLTDLGTPGVNSGATAINDRGQIIGETDTADGQILATVWQDGKASTLPGLGGYSQSVAENNAGLIIGNSQTSSGEWHAVVWSHGKLTDLGAGGAVAVNDSGQVLVWGGGQAPTAFLWQNGKETALPAGLWAVTGLNDKGQVVGTSGSETEGLDGFVWQDGTMTNLGSVQPLAINDRGQILTYGNGVIENGTTIALSPTENTPSAISGNGLVVGQSGSSLSATVWHVPAAN